MSFFLRRLLYGVWSLAALQGATAVQAKPLLPLNDAEVIEVLPRAARSRSDERRWRQQLAAQPQDARLAVALAQRYLEQARESGDPRYAGQALTALQAWAEPRSDPTEVVLLQATVRQHLHDFETAARLLEQLVQRDGAQAQAWLTLATVRRVQGRYAESDAACARLAHSGVTLYAAACMAENRSLRGEHRAAEAALQHLLQPARLPASTRNWLLTTLAEAQARAGRPQAAEQSYRAALQALADPYTVLSYADFLLQAGQARAAWAQLQDAPRSDAVLLRLAIAGTRAGLPAAAPLVRQVRERWAQASLRPDTQTLHAREHAMLALWLDHQPQRALALSRINIGQQREPLDWLVWAQAAVASGDPNALDEVRRLSRSVGLHDARLSALL